MKKFSEYLKEKRTAANLTQDKLAELIGVSLNSVQSWESGKYKPKKTKLYDLANHLGVDADELETVFNDDGEDFSNFPFFMYTDEQISIINTLRLTPEQKEFMMLIRIYNTERPDKSRGGYFSWDHDIMGGLRRIPYKYTEVKGVYKVYDFGEHLTKFLRYVPKEFCFEMIRNSPDTVFDLRTLDKKDILSWMDYCVLDQSYSQPRMDGLSRKSYYSSLSKSIVKFEERTIDTSYNSYYSYEKNSDMSLFDKTTDQYGRKYTLKLSEKGLLFQEWCKDIY
ncbi:MAG: helix-turn-helix transcriptional regulator [Ruminococcus sp.]|uniref:helix-turn-helix transcriptional regulator n=1 Tax=Ruminococcus sp. TaxID=41978 RepID=UPI0025F48AD7|nr:helix-turn-helix transcriptional regulator [Ruminococcus sp.]MCR5540981.1 helix-turn-helix transcriptional regulator [Ruminococcus sp.]